MTSAAFFGDAATVSACAPGRVNLLGEHTDYNDGYMLPIAIAQQTTVTLARSTDPYDHLYSATLQCGQTLARGRHGAPASRPAPGAAPTNHVEEAPHGFARYLAGCIAVLEQGGTVVPPLRVHVSSQVPVGAGLSSSAALEVAMLRALRRLLALELDDLALARLAQRAEVEHAGVHCGILDQMAASLADCTHMLWIDARTLAHRLLPLPAGAALVVLDSGVSRTLAASAYNERRRECETAAALLGVRALRDVSDPARLAQLPEPYRARARHVVTENARVLQACRGLTAPAFGALMNASHASLRDDFAVSVEALDRLVALLQGDRRVFGARLTGAGFGGACVALCASGTQHALAHDIMQRYAQAGYRGRILLPVQSPD